MLQKPDKNAGLAANSDNGRGANSLLQEAVLRSVQ